MKKIQSKNQTTEYVKLKRDTDRKKETWRE